MGVATRSRGRVRAVLDRLRAEHGAFDVVETRWDLPADEHAWIRERFEAGTVGGAGVWLANDAGEVLLVRDEGADAWADPGGKHEPGESLAETARRELREETGTACRLTGVAVAQRIAMVAEGRPPIVRLLVVFDGEYEAGRPRPEPGEIAAVRWWDAHPPALGYEALERLPIPADDASG